MNFVKTKRRKKKNLPMQTLVDHGNINSNLPQIFARILQLVILTHRVAEHVCILPDNYFSSLRIFYNEGKPRKSYHSFNIDTFI